MILSISTKSLDIKLGSILDRIGRLTICKRTIFIKWLGLAFRFGTARPESQLCSVIISSKYETSRNNHRMAG